MTMKSQYIAASFSFLALLFTACKKDNYTPPGSKFTGAIVYQGDSIQVATQQVSFQLWQSGFGKLTPIDVNVAQDGSFSALLFDGDYELVFPQGQGPFKSLVNAETNSDTIPVHVHGNTSLNVEVEPYYVVRDPQFSAGNGSITASCKLEKIITDAGAQDVESVTLYINKTTFVDNNNNIASASVSGGDITDMNNISLNVGVPDLVPTQDYIFARIGVKIANVEDLIFSPVMKIQLK